MHSKVAIQEPRKFLGKTDNFTDNKERHFYQRMLKAFLKGQDRFVFGFHFNKIGEKVPTFHKVECNRSGVLSEKEHEQLLQSGFCNGGKVFGGFKIGKSQLRKNIQHRLELKIAQEKELQKKNPRTLAQKLGLKK